MSLIAKLKSIIGRDEPREEDRDVTVTVEHDPQNEAAVKGTDADPAGSTGDADASAGDADATGDFEFGDVDDAAAGDESTDDSSLESAAIREAEPDTPAEADSDATDGSGSDTDGPEPDAAGSEPVDSLSGIGPAYADRLGDAGIETVTDLADADAAEVAAATDIAEGRVQGWIDQAGEH